MISPLLYFTTVLVVGIASQWLSWRLKFPAIIVLLVSGFALGQSVDADALIPESLLFPMVSLAVSVILFEGGLSLKLRELQQSRESIIRLCSVGVVATWIPITLAARLVFQSWEMAALAGALFVVTGPTVIVPLLRHIRPKSKVGSVAKWEGIVNDPIGAVLAVLVFETVIFHGSGAAAQGFAWGLAKTLLISVAIGGLTALLVVQILKRHWVPEYLENPVLLAFVVLTFTASNLLQKESGLATVTLFGIALANQKTVRIQHVVEFKENLVVLLISVLFIVLGSRLSLDDLTALGWQGPVFLALLILAVRPFSVFVSTWKTRLNWREQVFLSALAPRGIVAAAVASVFALEITEHERLREVNPNLRAIDPVIAADAERLVPVTFLVIFGTVTVYGLAASPLARKLGIADSDPQGLLFAGAHPVVQELAKAVQESGFTVLLVDTNYDNMSAARMRGLPTQTASILSEFVANELDLSGIGRLLAMTPNDEVNSLAVRQFAELFGRANLFQLPPRAAQQKSARGTVAQKLTGRYLFREGMTFERLTHLYADGARIKKTLLTEEFEFSDFVELYGDDALILAIVDDTGKQLKLVASESKPTPKTGQTLISLVRSREPAAEKA